MKIPFAKVFARLLVATMPVGAASAQTPTPPVPSPENKPVPQTDQMTPPAAPTGLRVIATPTPQVPPVSVFSPFDVQVPAAAASQSVRELAKRGPLPLEVFVNRERDLVAVLSGTGGPLALGRLSERRATAIPSRNVGGTDVTFSADFGPFAVDRQGPTLIVSNGAGGLATLTRVEGANADGILDTLQLNNLGERTIENVGRLPDTIYWPRGSFMYADSPTFSTRPYYDRYGDWHVYLGTPGRMERLPLERDSSFAPGGVRMTWAAGTFVIGDETTFEPLGDGAPWIVQDVPTENVNLLRTPPVLPPDVVPASALGTVPPSRRAAHDSVAHVGRTDLNYYFLGGTDGDQTVALITRKSESAAGGVEAERVMLDLGPDAFRVYTLAAGKLYVDASYLNRSKMESPFGMLVTAHAETAAEIFAAVAATKDGAAGSTIRDAVRGIIAR